MTAVAAVLGLVASGPARAATMGEPEGQTAQPQPEAQRRFFAGMSAAVGEALGASDVTEAQRAELAGLQGPVKACEGKVESARKNFSQVLADGIRNDRFSGEAVDSAIGGLATAYACEGNALSDAIVSIHGILTPAQRIKFADALGKGLQGRRGLRSTDTWLGPWAKSLSLEEAQTQQIRGILESSSRRAAQADSTVDRVIAAFREDKLDRTAIAPRADADAVVRERLHEMVDTAAKITAVLTPEQREKAAAMLQPPTKAEIEANSSDRQAENETEAAPPGEAQAELESATPEQAQAELEEGPEAVGTEGQAIRGGFGGMGGRGFGGYGRGVGGYGRGVGGYGRGFGGYGRGVGGYGHGFGGYGRGVGGYGRGWGGYGGYGRGWGGYGGYGRGWGGYGRGWGGYGGYGRGWGGYGRGWGGWGGWSYPYAWGASPSVVVVEPTTAVVEPTPYIDPYVSAYPGYVYGW